MATLLKNGGNGDMKNEPNQPAAANPAIASELQAGRNWRGVAEPER